MLSDTAGNPGERITTTPPPTTLSPIVTSTEGASSVDIAISPITPLMKSGISVEKPSVELKLSLQPTDSDWLAKLRLESQTNRALMIIELLSSFVDGAEGVSASFLLSDE